jgi:hypothetical protein
LALAPDIFDAIFSGRAGQSVMLESLEQPLPASWDGQREQLCGRVGEYSPAEGLL